MSLLCPCRVIFITSTLGCRFGCRVGSKLWRNLPSGPWSKWTMEEPVSWTSHGVAMARHAGHHDLVGTLQEIVQIIEDLRVLGEWHLQNLADFGRICEETSWKETQVLWSHKGNRQSLVRSMWSMWSMAVSFVTYQNGNLLVTFTQFWYSDCDSKLRQEPFRPARPVRPMRCV